MGGGIIGSIRLIFRFASPIKISLHPKNMDGINKVTRYLQFVKNFYVSEAATINKELSSIINKKNNQEPYYKYLISDNDYTDHEQRNEYFKNCADLLKAYAVTLESKCLNDIIGLRTTEVFYNLLNEIELTDFSKKALGFFSNIRNLLKTPPNFNFLFNPTEDYGMMGLLNFKDVEENEEQQPSGKKKDGIKKVKKKN